MLVHERSGQTERTLGLPAMKLPELPDVSFIIVSWNTKALLRQCIASILAELAGLVTEILVVDNASSDGSPEIVKQEFPAAQLIRNATNVGFARANNQAIAVSRGRFLCLVNSDVVVHPGCLRAMIQFMDANPRIGLAGPKVLNADGTLQSSCRAAPSLRAMFFRMLSLDTLFPRSPLFGEFFMTNWDHNSQREVGILSGCCWFARRTGVEAVGGLNEAFFMYAEDMDWCLRFRRAGWLVMFNPSASITHYGGASSSREPIRFFVEKQRADLQYWRLHHGTVAYATYYLSVIVEHLLRVAGYSARHLVWPSGRVELRGKIIRSAACLMLLLTLLFRPSETTMKTPPPVVG